MTNDYLRCLEDCDVKGIQKLWSATDPHLPQPQSDQETLITIHKARTESKAVKPRLRFYSHKWLLDQGYPSSLPEELKPTAERTFPPITSAVGISVNSSSPFTKDLVLPLRKALEDAVLEAYADGKTNPEYITKRFKQVRQSFK